MSYFVLSGGKLQERASNFKVVRIVPMDWPGLDSTLMPEFPGLSGVENCRDWKPGIPVDLSRIRKKDEDYWTKYRGTPKAYVNLSMGQTMWGNRWGDLTAIRFHQHDEKHLGDSLRSSVPPAKLGLFFAPVREQALAAARPPFDMGQLFLGFSIFLIAAAALLTGLLFSLGVQQRWSELGLLRAVGLGRGQVRRMLLLEGAAIAAVGCVVGVAAGVGYGRAMVWALATIWSGAVGGAQLQFHVQPTSLLAGGAGALAIAMAAIWLGVRNAMKLSPRELLGGFHETSRARAGKGRLSLIVGLASAGGAVAIIAIFGTGGGAGADVSEMFFAAAALLLVASLSVAWYVLARLAGRASGKLTFASLALCNSTRRRGRSLATVTLLACGSFMVVAVAAFHQSAGPEGDASGPAGGFDLLARSTIPIKYDLGSELGQKSLGLKSEILAGTTILQLRVSGGDEASCLNLNAPGQPRLYGVPTEELERRGAFKFVKTLTPTGSPWAVLREPTQDGAVRAVGDVNTVTWALGKGLGDTVTCTDEQGLAVKIRIVGIIANSVLQGGLIIDETAFVKRFPSSGGSGMLLVQTPPGKQAAVAAELSRAMRDFGLEVTPTARRLAEFNGVENAYLSIFQALGGLGMVLGSAGLAVVVLRNVMERRGELALMQAVGFDKGTLARLVLMEHWGLLAAGVAIGVFCAAVAVAPMILHEGRELPYAWLAAAMIFIAVSGLAWVYLATRLALGGQLLPALRSE